MIRAHAPLFSWKWIVAPVYATRKNCPRDDRRDRKGLAPAAGAV